MTDNRPIAFVLGSDSDLSALEGAFTKLRELDIGFHVRILSAHRTPDQAAEFARTAQDNGIRVLIGVAGMAAHLAGGRGAPPPPRPARPPPPWPRTRRCPCSACRSTAVRCAARTRCCRRR